MHDLMPRSLVQAAVREALYEGLGEVLLADPGSQTAVAELLLPHFHRFLDRRPGADAPVLLEKCASVEVRPAWSTPLVGSTRCRGAGSHLVPRMLHATLGACSRCS
jgi:hypothetical protein